MLVLVAAFLYIFVFGYTHVLD